MLPVYDENGSFGNKRLGYTIEELKYIDIHSDVIKNVRAMFFREVISTKLF